MPDSGLSQPVPAESPTFADICQRVAAVEAVLAALQARLDKPKRPKPPAAIGQRRTRRDRCPFGWRPHSSEHSTKLVPDVGEQKTIVFILDAASTGVGLHAICRLLDSYGMPRRGKKWASGGHTLVRAIIQRAKAADAPPPAFGAS
jgi:hypothetical protein